MPKRETRWMRVRALSGEEKHTVSTACQHFIDRTLKPRFLPEVRASEFNYPVDIVGKWRGNKYSFIVRYRSGFPDSLGEEFDAPFTRLDHVAECVTDVRFDLMWHRHNGQWWRLHASVTLEEALKLIETQPVLQPHT
jgi:hypothetical protein